MIDVAARRAEHVIVVAALVLTALALSQLTLSPAWSMTIGACTLAAISAGFARIGWLGGARRLERIVCRPDGHWVLCDAGGRVVAAELTNVSRVSTSSVWLCWATPRATPLLIMRGDIPAGDFRRLVVKLRVAPFPTQDGRQDVV